MIVPATVSDVKNLTSIALQSKAFWGYSNGLIQSWKEDLTVTSKMVDTCFVYKDVFKEEITGFYVLNPPINASIELELLFVLPKFIGKGIGKKLLQHSFLKATELHCNAMTLLADPNAVSFYKSQGFVVIGQKESSIPNRFLPIMKKVF